MTMGEIQELLTGLMRGIDKKTELTVEPPADAAAPRLTVRLRCAKRTGSLQVSEADVLAAQTDLMLRNRLRTALKRARDRMWNETSPIFSTKMQRPKESGGTWFQPMQGRRGRR
jgi:hypothetical protein